MHTKTITSASQALAQLGLGSGATLVGYGQRAVADKLGELVSTLDYGIAVGLVSDQTAQLNAAIADAAANSQTLELIGRVRVDGQIILPNGASLRSKNASAIIDCSASTLTSGGILAATGTLGVAMNVVAAVNRYDRTVNVPAHGLNAGDWFRIISTIDSQSAAAGDDRLGDRGNVVYLTETHQVATVPDANTIGIVGGFRFAYPAGSAVKKITPVTGIKLCGIKIEHAGKTSMPVLLTLCQRALIEDIEVMNAGGEIAMRGCFDGSRIVRPRAYGSLATASANSNALIKIMDGCVGVQVTDIDLANGGQLVDVTYTPSMSATLGAPCLDTSIRGGTCRNAYASAIVDHPSCDGTTVQDITMHDVRGAVYIRSRNGRVRNIKAWGGIFGDAVSIGIWAGEDGYWSGLNVEGCDVYGFETGYFVGGVYDTLHHSDATFLNNTSHRCTIGENWVSASSPQNDSGIRSYGSRHIFPIATGIKIDGTCIGAQFKDFIVRGPVTGAAVEIAGSLTDAVIDGTVIDLGATIPALFVSSSTPARIDTRIHRRGPCGLNVGITRAMVRTAAQVLFNDATEYVHTGTTSTTTVKSPIGRVPAGAFEATMQLKVTVYGKRTGSAGTATIVPKLDTTIAFTSVTLPAGSSGDFRCEFTIDGTGAASQRASSSYLLNGATPGIVSGIARALDLKAGVNNIPLQVTLSNAADSVSIESVITEASWA